VRFRGGNLGYDLGDIWCGLVGRLGLTKVILMVSRAAFSGSKGRRK